MTSYAFWNNKGGVGKSYLCFVTACEYAHRHPAADVYVLDMCPQANTSETILGGMDVSTKAITKLLKMKPRATVAGYLEARLNSPFVAITDIEPFVTHPCEYNDKMPENLYLVCGDNLLEVQSEAIRQTSQLSVPVDAWKKVVLWLADLVTALRKRSGERETIEVIDCNPSFSVYTQLALAAAERIVVPFTADDSSRRAVENVVALLYGVGDAYTSTYARISFGKRAKDEGINVPRLHTFVANRITKWGGEPSHAFKAIIKAIKATMKTLHEEHKSAFVDQKGSPSKHFVEIPDYHGASIYSAVTGTPLHLLKSGPKFLQGERIQLNSDPLSNYRDALEALVLRI